MVSLRLVLSNPTLPEITDGYEIQLHHALGHDPGYPGTDKAPGNFFTDFSGAFGPKCFPSNTPILLASGEMRAICAVRAGDLILAFDGAADLGRGALVPKRVTRLYRNETTEWVRLSWEEGGAARELVVTSGHRFLTAHGTFEQIGDMAAGGRATAVLADGRLRDVVAERIVYSAETAGLFELGRTFDNSNCIKAA